MNKISTIILTITLICFSIQKNYAQVLGANYFNSSFVCNDGTVWTTGDNDYGQLGNGVPNNMSINVPMQVRGANGIGYLTNVKSICSGNFCTIALTNDGTVWAWGKGTFGELGNGMSLSSNYPVQVVDNQNVPLSNVKSISTNSGTTTSAIYALKNDGTVWAWGSNEFNKLGSGSIGDSSNVALQVKGEMGIGNLDNVIQISAGENQMMVLKQDGTVWTWGKGGNGRLGNGSTTNQDYPVQVLGAVGIGAYLNGVSSIASGDDFCLALRNDGTLWAWGYNLYGQLGINTTSFSQTTPVQVLNEIGNGALLNIVKIDAGNDQSYALDNSGILWTWGWALYGNGTGLSGNLKTPKKVKNQAGTADLTDVFNFKTGYKHTIAIAKDINNNDILLGWGNGTNGGLGNGSNILQAYPTPVTLFCNFTTGINETEIQKSLTIYPNPNKGTFDIYIPIELQNKPNLQFTLYDMLGNLINKQVISANELNNTIKIDNISNGVYNFKIHYENIIFNSKIVIFK
jgi:alpha-tubulin suppressor-like RCC1 family protein